MGEYAKYGNGTIKIGTCETMFYLRYDQRHQVTPLRGNVDPSDAEQAMNLFFRFPFPWEDGKPPGSFDPFTSYPLRGYRIGDDTHHGLKQFSGTGGYLISLPCPETEAFQKLAKQAGTRLHHNGYPGAVSLVYQKPIDGELRTIVRCNGCGNLWSLDSEDAEKAAEALRAAADSSEKQDPNDISIRTMREIAKRILAGYHEKNSQSAATVAH